MSSIGLSSFDFDLSGHACIYNIRIDPLDQPVQLRIKRIQLHTAAGQVLDIGQYCNNAICRDDQGILFEHSDPQLWFPAPHIGSRLVFLRVEIDYLAVGTAVQSMIGVRNQTCLASLTEAIAQRDAQIAALTQLVTQRDDQLTTMAKERCQCEMSPRDSTL